MQAVRFLTHGKVNLFLRVLGLRADGFHEVETILQVVDLADEIEIVPTTSGTTEIDMTTRDGAGIPDREDNLVFRAATALVANGATNAGLRMTIKKGVPVGAGMGGGSANAAGALVVLNEMWKTGFDKAKLIELAGELGSDVPYCVAGGTVLATGRGEKLTPLPSPDQLWFVLGLSAEPLSTAKVYGAWDSLDQTSEISSSSMTMALGAGDVAEVAACLHNDLEEAAFTLRPELRDLKEAMLDAGALGSCMSGSGPTIVGIASSNDHADEVASRLSSAFDQVIVVPSRTECIVRLD